MRSDLKRILCALAIANFLAGSHVGAAIARESDALSGTSSNPLVGTDFGMSLDPLLSAIEQLESDHDVKCQSSANRFEDLLFGTPLSDEYVVVGGPHIRQHTEAFRLQFLLGLTDLPRGDLAVE